MKESHIYKEYLATFISTIIKHICMSGLVLSECGAALIVASLGPGPAAGSEGGGVVTRHMHTLHSPIIAPQLLLGCMKWRVTVTPSVKLRYDVIYLIHYYETSVLFSQLFASQNFGDYTDTFTFVSF